MHPRAVKLIIRGRVQRVGYRAAVYGAISDKLPEISGYVKNLSNGDVEMHLQGEAHAIKKAIDIAYLGSRRCKVESIEVLELTHNEKRYENFIIES
jgi:acylphosphatase